MAPSFHPSVPLSSESELLEYLGGRGKSRASIEDMELLKDAPVGSNSGNGILIWKSPRSSCFLSSSKTT